MGGQAGADEIEVTPEMVDAGLAALREESADDYSQLPLEAEVIEAVFRAMVAASPRKFLGLSRPC